jgi:hypothetical protein
VDIVEAAEVAGSWLSDSAVFDPVLGADWLGTAEVLALKEAEGDGWIAELAGSDSLDPPEGRKVEAPEGTTPEAVL